MVGLISSIFGNSRERIKRFAKTTHTTRDNIDLGPNLERRMLNGLMGRLKFIVDSAKAVDMLKSAKIWQ